MFDRGQKKAKKVKRMGSEGNGIVGGLRSKVVGRKLLMSETLVSYCRGWRLGIACASFGF